MFEISAKTYENTYTITLHIKEIKSVLWVKIHDIEDKLCVKNVALRLLQKNKRENTKDMEKNLLAT